MEFDHCMYTFIVADLQDFLMVKICEMITIFYHFLNDTLVNIALNTIINIISEYFIVICIFVSL